MSQRHPDTPMLEHVQELISKLDSLGIQPSPDDEDGDGNEWEDVDDSDEDVDMS